MMWANVTYITMLAIPGVWANIGAQILPIKWGHEGAQNAALLVDKFWARSRSWRHLMGRTGSLLDLLDARGTHAVKNAVQLQE